MKIIGIAGQAGVGKSTFADELLKELQSQNKKCVILNLADKIKYIAIKIFDWDGQKDDYGRNLLQNIGTEIGRNQINENIWLDEMYLLIRFAEMNNYDFVIIPDIRFKNEIEYWKDKNYETIFIRLKRKCFISNLNNKAKLHQSENDLLNYNIDNFEITNDLSNLNKHCKNFIKIYNIL